MLPVPASCSACHVRFDAGDPRRRLVLLEDRFAVCSECEWRAWHPEALVTSHRRPAKPSRRQRARVSVAAGA